MAGSYIIRSCFEPLLRRTLPLIIRHLPAYVTDATGGEDGPRTHDLLNAIQTLSQTELQPHTADRLCVHDRITYWISNRISQNSYDLLSWWSTHSRVLNDPAFSDSSKNNYNHMVPKAGLEPARVTPPDFESGTSTNSITRANKTHFLVPKAPASVGSPYREFQKLATIIVSCYLYARLWLCRETSARFCFESV